MELSQNNLVSINLSSNQQTNKVYKTGQELGLPLSFLNIFKNIDKVMFEVITIDIELGTIDINCIFKKGNIQKTKRVKIECYKTIVQKNREDVEKYLEKLDDQYLTIHQTLLPIWKKDTNINKTDLGINLPINLDNITIDMIVIENNEDGIVKVKAKLSKGKTIFFKTFTVIGFKTRDSQNLDDVLVVKKIFNDLKNSKTSLTTKSIDDFITQSYSKTELGFNDEPKKLNGVMIKSYNVQALDAAGFLIINVLLTKGNHSQIAIFKLEGFLTREQQLIAQFAKIVDYLNTLTLSNAFDLKQKIRSHNSWFDVWNALYKHLVYDKKYDEIVVKQINWAPLNHQNEQESCENMLIYLPHNKATFNKKIQIWIQPHNKKIININFKEFLADQILLDKIVLEMRNNSKDQVIIMKLKKTSQWADKTVQDYVNSKNFLEAKKRCNILGLSINWQEFLSLELENNYLEKHSDVNVILQFSMILFSNKKCRFIMLLFKNNTFKKVSYADLIGFK